MQFSRTAQLVLCMAVGVCSQSAMAQGLSVAVVSGNADPACTDGLRDELMVTTEFDRVDILDASVSIPTTLDLDASIYDAVIVVTDTAWVDSVGLGDTLLRSWT